ncbi:MAG: hypothetical protein P1U88_22765 [Thalassobaculaceae bacterium]|nr:hypothetical protein [Thalassobaculaceae bacterium]
MDYKIWSLAVGFALIALGIKMAVFTFKLWRGDGAEYASAHERTPGLLNVILGRATTFFDRRRDFRVNAGIAVRKGTWTIEERGRLSDEAVADITRK